MKNVQYSVIISESNYQKVNTEFNTNIYNPDLKMSNKKIKTVLFP